MRFSFLSASLLLLAACASAPDPSDPEAFDRQAAISLTQELSRDALFGRQPGTEGSARAQEMIIARMAQHGVIPIGENGYRQPFIYGDFINRETGEQSTPDKPGINLIGLIEGRSNSPLTLVITAHYDHIGVRDGEIYNGADDNASGVGALMAVAEYFSKAPPRHDVILVALDAEEGGLHGARAFVSNPPIERDFIAANLNLDMVSRGDNGILWASGTAHWPEMKPIMAALSARAPVDIQMGFDEGNGREDWTLLSDHAAFFRAGIPHIYFGVEDHPDYHKPTDDFERVDQDWFLRSIDSVIMVASEMDDRLDEIYAMRLAAAVE